MTGLRYEAQQLLFQGKYVSPSHGLLSDNEIGNEATLSVVLKGCGGMSDASDTDDAPSRKRRRLSRNKKVDGAFDDFGLLRRCLCRVHRFSPGAAGRELIRDGDRCASLGHWSLITGHVVEASSLSHRSLDAACRAGRVDAIDSLVSHYGIDVNSRDTQGWTPLHTAMVHNDADSCRRLLALGAEDTATNDGEYASSLRPRLWARITGGEVSDAPDWWELPGDLRRAKIQLKNHGSGMMEVFCRRVCAAVEKLGAAVIHGSVLAMAARNGHYSACRVCIELGAQVDTPDNFGQTPLFLACRFGSIDCVRLLLEVGATINGTRESALYWACFGGHADCARLVLDYGADVDDPKECGKLPLSAAVRLGHSDCVRLLLDRGADVTMTDEMNSTPLHAACAHGNLECVRLLLDKGAGVDVEDDSGCTPLHRACRQNQRRVALILLEHGADPARRNEHGMTPANLAAIAFIASSNLELVEVMELAIRDRATAMERLRGMDDS